MRKLFGRSKPDPASIVAERWETKFFLKRRARFREEKTADYEARLQGHALELTLKRRNLFAWVENPLYRYHDFVLEAEISLPAEGYSSAGVLFRYVNESSYYYFLVSTRGYFRFDVVFNGSPMRLIDWTELPRPEGAVGESPSEATEAEPGAPSEPSAPFKLLVVANGTRFTLCCNDRWIAEIDDETIESGGVAFGAQNYDERDTVTAAMNRILVDSRGMEVETFHYRWRETIPVDPDARLRLARTLLAAENPTAAIIQIRKALRSTPPNADSLFLLAECQVNLGLNENALENVEKVLSLDPLREEAQREKANLLYLLGRYFELREYLDSRVGASGSSTLWNLYGHAHYSLGNWDAAARAYATASELEPDMPIFHVNTARASEHIGDLDEALDRYLAAGRLFIRQDAMGELAKIIPSIMEIDPDNHGGRVFEGTIAFQEGNLVRAGELFERVVAEGVEDSAVCYMQGIVRARQGDRRGALALFEQAVALEREYPLYWFRLAETRYLLGEDPSEALRRARELSPDDAWTLNLAGQILLDEGRLSEAAEVLARAARNAPAEAEIAVNYAEALFRRGEEREAVAMLEKRSDGHALNTLGNFYTRLNESEKALRAYERAYAAAPDDPVICENLAAACIESDLVQRAEELLGRLVDWSPSASVLNRVGNLARIEGDFVRAEAAYRESFAYLALPEYDRELSKEDLGRLERDDELNTLVTEIEYNLADLYVLWSRYDKAEIIGRRMQKHARSGRAGALAQRVRAATQVYLACATCGREWWAPKRVDVPERLLLEGEPPEDSPAGKCVRCGKIYCVGCAKEHLSGNRFICPDCNEYLKLNDDHLKYLVLKAIEISQKGHP